MLAINGVSVDDLPMYDLSGKRLAGNVEQITIKHGVFVYDLPIVLIPIDSRYKPIYYSP